MTDNLRVLAESAVFWEDLRAKWLARGNQDAATLRKRLHSPGRQKVTLVTFLVLYPSRFCAIRAYLAAYFGILNFDPVSGHYTMIIGPKE